VEGCKSKLHRAQTQRAAPEEFIRQKTLKIGSAGSVVGIDAYERFETPRQMKSGRKLNRE
jgi:hypothetical protein